ncbi:hypothetical protein AB9T89_12925 [Flavobacterium oncorhynchi]|uniref:hypothetical protein n=1 Tax=Flavobacterium oncorhynchi TaxID=728056 RepID=UPI00351A2E8E
MTQIKLEKTTGINQFNNYLENHSDDAKTSKINDFYYHVDVVADAYSRGYNDGEKSAKKEVMDLIVLKAKEKFIEKANEVYLSSKALVRSLATKRYKVEKIYINIFHKSPKVIVAVEDSMLLNDDFVEFAYTTIHEMQCSFHSLFQNTLDLSLISTTDLDEELLAKDGFDYSEVL